MRAVDIHPEELIDKLADGSLSLAERERLNAHLAQCSSCRFEIAVRADLAQDTPALEERPQLTLAGGAGSERAPQVPPERAAARASLRPRGKRWPLVMLAAALVLCAGGAMAAVITGAVGARWLPWSAESKPAEGVRVSDAKSAPKLKRAVVASASALAPALEPTASSAVPAPSVVEIAPSAPIAFAPAPVAPAAPSAAPSRPGARALSARASARPASAGVLATAPAVVDSGGVSVAHVDAAALFADANRARRDGNLDLAVGLYRTLQSRYPSSSESELSRALLAQLLLDRGNPEAALAGFDRYLAQDSPALAAEALVGRARALEQLGKSTQAAAAWRQVESRFPGSVHARLAATRLAALGMR